jgi:hypothetical protein
LSGFLTVAFRQQSSPPRDLLDADIWLYLRSLFSLDTEVPPHAIQVIAFCYFEIDCSTFDVVVFDEADMVYSQI